MSSILLLILLHDALLIFGGFSLANNFFTLDLEGGLIVKKKSLQLVPSGGTATVGSGKLDQNKEYTLHCLVHACCILLLTYIVASDRQSAVDTVEIFLEGPECALSVDTVRQIQPGS